MKNILLLAHRLGCDFRPITVTEQFLDRIILLSCNDLGDATLFLMTNSQYFCESAFSFVSFDIWANRQ